MYVIKQWLVKWFLNKNKASARIAKALLNMPKIDE